MALSRFGLKILEEFAEGFAEQLGIDPDLSTALLDVLFEMITGDSEEMSFSSSIDNVIATWLNKKMSEKY